MPWPPQSQLHPETLKVLERLASSSPPRGSFVELGVYLGGSAASLYEIAQKQGRSLYLFDTWTGIPTAGPGDEHKIGDFNAGASALPQCRVNMPRAKFTVANFLDIHPGRLQVMAPIAFVHVDCDQYEPTAAVIRHLSPLMMRTGTMLFDDYGCLASATRAVEEAFRDRSIGKTPQGRAFVRFG